MHGLHLNGRCIGYGWKVQRGVHGERLMVYRYRCIGSGSNVCERVHGEKCVTFMYTLVNIRKVFV